MCGFVVKKIDEQIQLFDLLNYDVIGHGHFQK